MASTRARSPPTSTTSPPGRRRSRSRTTGCPCTVGGTTYAYRSTDLTAYSPLGEGAKSYTVSAADQVANSVSQTGSVTVDNSGPTIATVIAGTTTNVAGFVSRGVTYRVYANVTDGSSGVDTSSVTADVRNITNDQTSVALTPAAARARSAARAMRTAAPS